MDEERRGDGVSDSGACLCIGVSCVMDGRFLPLGPVGTLETSSVTYLVPCSFWQKISRKMSLNILENDTWDKNEQELL